MREIASEVDDGDVRWRSYELRDGQPTGDFGVCSVSAIIRWADREATQEEVAKLRRREAQDIETKQAIELVGTILEKIPNDLLLVEVRRRGFDVAE